MPGEHRPADSATPLDRPRRVGAISLLAFDPGLFAGACGSRFNSCAAGPIYMGYMALLWSKRPRWRTVAFPAAALCWVTLMHAYKADTGERHAADLVSATVTTSHVGANGGGRR